MRQWLWYFKGKQVSEDGMPKNLPLPECGTVGCMAGWINTVTRNTKDGLGNRSAQPALAILDLKVDFFEDKVGWDLNQIFWSTHDPKRTTLKKVREYLKEHKEALTLKKVQVL